jgi:hypothetical protein
MASYPRYFKTNEDARVQVGPSKIATRGVLARKPIERGHDFGRYCPQSSPIEPSKTGTYYGLEIYVSETGKKYMVDGMCPYGTVEHWTALINHSFRPNLEFGDDGHVCALRDISVGEELFVDYGIKYWRAAFPELAVFKNGSLYALLTHERTPEEQGLADEVRSHIDVSSLFKRLEQEIAAEVLKRQMQIELQRELKFVHHRQYYHLVSSGKKRKVFSKREWNTLSSASRTHIEVVPDADHGLKTFMFSSAVPCGYRKVGLFAIPISWLSKNALAAARIIPNTWFSCCLKFFHPQNPDFIKLVDKLEAHLIANKPDQRSCSVVELTSQLSRENLIVCKSARDEQWFFFYWRSDLQYNV